MDIKNWSIEWGGRTLTFEVGRLALLTAQTVTARYGDTMVMATVMRSERRRDELDYFPLTVDFEEKLYAAGKIKGSRFIKREGRPSDESILNGRIIDRTIRPLFDDSIRNDVQVILTPLSVDGENDSALTGLLAASCALALSPIPWAGPVAGARIGRINGQLVLNATTSQLTESDLDLIVAGTPESLIMTEAGAKEVNEADMYAAMKWGLNELKPVIDLISKITAEIGKEKMDLTKKTTEVGEADKMREEVRRIAREYIADHADDVIFARPRMSRLERNDMIHEVEDAIKKIYTEKQIPEEFWPVALNSLKMMIGDAISKRILDKGQRLDNRSLTDIRPLNIDVDLLPRVHGSAMFMRGDTQVLSVVTLGSPGDVQTLDTMEEDGKKRYMHHYNDAPYTYGECGRVGSPGRRAIGHGALAERALEPVLPAEEDFPYAIRVVSEVLGSNGSSSMASTCGSTLSLMATGVPIKKPVAGIAMGLASDESGRFKVLTDLQDVEDGKGGMDFKIAGTIDGITAIQMDTKTRGLSLEIVEQTIKQAFEARKFILAEMSKVIATPRTELSKYAPRIVTIKIDPEKIRDVIGSGGKVINKIIEDTGVQIDIEQDGRVMVTSSDAAGLEKALKIINDITREIQAGEIFDGAVVRLEDFGAFVQLTPNKDGLVHVSEIAWTRTNRPADVLKLGDVVKVKVKEIDNLGRVNLTMKELLPKPEGWTPPPAFDRGDRGPRQGGFNGGRSGGFVKRDR
ncbi:MAG TPA: polyribonucleotide nucleotidyltransferase [Candidatus Magasanikbacteria bacterium]|nr:polyribonucleotide nucleotidyltransferase [Candidatus Magasanikbacteria bacterium]